MSGRELLIKTVTLLNYQNNRPIHHQDNAKRKTILL